MTIKAQYIDGVLTLTDLSGEGGPLIRVYRDSTCSLFEIPQYGGEEMYIGEFSNPCLALDEAAKWT